MVLKGAALELGSVPLELPRVRIREHPPEAPGLPLGELPLPPTKPRPRQPWASSTCTSKPNGAMARARGSDLGQAWGQVRVDVKAEKHDVGGWGLESQVGGRSEGGEGGGEGGGTLLGSLGSRG